MFDISPLRMCVFVTLLFFFFKQKTAYEMRISDWSSDVCSSDLAFERGADGADDLAHRLGERLCDLGLRHADLRRAAVDEVAALDRHDHPVALRRDGTADSVLDALRRHLADHHIVLAADLRGDHVLHLVAPRTEIGTASVRESVCQNVSN